LDERKEVAVQCIGEEAFEDRIEEVGGI